MSTIYGSASAANVMFNKNNPSVAFSAGVAPLTDPNWTNRAGYGISTTTTTNDTVTTNGGGTSTTWEAYDSETISTSNSNDIEFQLNGSTFYTASGYAQSTLNGYYAVTQNYFGDTMPASFVAIKTSGKYTFKLTNGSSQWQDKNGMDTLIGFNDTNNPTFQAMEWQVVFGVRATVKKLEVWREGSANIEYTASTTLSDNDEISVVYNV